jgi:inositol phosphorylceramide mannosyltransferase catalytic subunit
MIPKIIHQTWKDEKLPKNFTIWHQKVKDLNPNCEVRLWTDADIENFMVKEYPEHLELFRGYELNIERVDVWRYFVLHKIGGMYLDLDMEPFNKFDDLFDHDLVLALEHPNDAKHNGVSQSIAQAVMLSKPANPFFSHLISRLKDFANVIERKPLSTTGPMFMTNVYNEYKPDCLLLDSECFFSLKNGKYASHRYTGTWRKRRSFKSRKMR